MSAGRQRDHVSQIAESDPAKALSQAGAIADPWFATQALAAVLRYCPEASVDTVLRRALATAAQCPDAYRRGAVLAWVIRALAERGKMAMAADVLQSALQQARQARPAGSRGEAFLLLYQAAHPLGSRSLEPILKLLVSLQQSAPHWRVSRALVRAATIHSSVAPASLPPILRPVDSHRLTARIERSIALGFTHPREFF